MDLDMQTIIGRRMQSSTDGLKQTNTDSPLSIVTLKGRYINPIDRLRHIYSVIKIQKTAKDRQRNNQILKRTESTTKTDRHIQSGKRVRERQRRTERGREKHKEIERQRNRDRQILSGSHRSHRVNRTFGTKAGDFTGSSKSDPDTRRSQEWIDVD